MLTKVWRIHLNLTGPWWICKKYYVLPCIYSSIKDINPQKALSIYFLLEVLMKTPKSYHRNQKNCVYTSLWEHLYINLYLLMVMYSYYTDVFKLYLLVHCLKISYLRLTLLKSLKYLQLHLASAWLYHWPGCAAFICMFIPGLSLYKKITLT